MTIFEALMLICFGISWPFSIYKSYTSRSTQGKSLFFLMIVDLGYVFGIIHKIFFNMDWVLYLYVLNLFMVSFDIGLYFRNKNYTIKNVGENVEKSQ